MLRIVFLAALLASPLTGPSAAQQNPPTLVSGQTSPWRASKMVGVPVNNAANERLGEINDLLMDHAGQVSHVVIAVGGLQGNAERLVAVKLDVIRFPHRPEPGTAPASPVNDRWYPELAVLATTKDALLALPALKY